MQNRISNGDLLRTAIKEIPRVPSRIIGDVSGMASTSGTRFKLLENFPEEARPMEEQTTAVSLQDERIDREDSRLKVYKNCEVRSGT